MFKKIPALLVFCMASVCSPGQASLHVLAGASLKLDSGGMVTLNNTNFIVDGTFQQSPGDGTMMFTGPMATSISGTALPVFDKLSIARGTGNTLSLQHTIDVVSQVRFLSGLLDLNNNNLDLRGTGLLVNESDSSRIIGPLGGEVISTADLNAPVAANPGNLGAFITSTQDLGSTTIRRGHQPQALGGMQGRGGTQVSIFRYFDIAPTNDANLNATLRQQYFDGELNGVNPDSLQMWRSDDTSNWLVAGYTDRDTGQHYVDLSGIDSFSRWTLASGATFTFLSFNAVCASGQTNITWGTSPYANVTMFEVERSADSINWQIIGNVTGFSFTDKNPLPGNNDYRIVAFNGINQVGVSPIFHANCVAGEICTILPNPVKYSAWVSITTSGYSNASIRLFDNRGRLVLSRELPLTPGNTLYNLDMVELARGTYEIRVDWGSGHHLTELIEKL